MSDDENKNPENPFEGFSFGPAWARDTSDEATIKVTRAAGGPDRPRFNHDRDGDRPRFRRDRDGERPRFNRDRDGDRPRFNRDRDGERPRFQRDRDGDRPRFNRDRDGGERFERKPRLPVDFTIRFIPEQSAIEFFARKIRSTKKTMSLRDIVKVVFQTPDSVLVRVEYDEEHRDSRFHQCKKCGFFARTEEAVLEHLLAAHFTDFFESREIKVDPPSGKFTSVAKCGVTGKLLAPPNHHLYNRRIREMLAGECAGMSEADYRKRIEFVTDPEEIERWRNECTSAFMWTRKADSAAKKPAPEKPAEAAPAENAEAPAEAEAAPAEQPAEAEAPAEQLMSREEAEEIFTKEIAPGLLRAGRQVTVSNKASKTIRDLDILEEIRRAWMNEQRSPVGALFLAIRGGLRARKLHFFRSNENHREEFVTHCQPTPLDPSVAVAEIKAILAFVAEHPGCSQEDLLVAIPGDEARKQLDFLIEFGNILDYAKSGLRLPTGAKAPEAAPAPAAPAAEAPAPEKPAKEEEKVAPFAPPPAEEKPAAEAASEKKEEESATPAVAEEFTKPESETPAP